MNYSEEEKETIDKIETLCKYLDVWKENYTIVPKDKRYFKTVLNLIQKQEKIIDKFSKALVNCVGTCPIDYNDDFENDCENCQDTLEKCWIEYFKKEVEKECNIKNG